MAQSLNIKPMFGPQVDDDAAVPLPCLPMGITPELDAAITRYRAAFFSNDDDGEAAAKQAYRTAHEIAGIPATTQADIAAKLIIGLHDSHPSLQGDQLALDAGSFETDSSGRILLSVLSDLLAPPSRPDRTEWEAVEADYHKAWKLWDDLGDEYTNEESDAVAAIAFPAMERMMDTPAPDAAAMLMKMIAAREGNRIVNEDDMDALVADARRFAARESGTSTSDLVSLLIERNALVEHIDGDGLSDEQAEDDVGRLNEIDVRILATPAACKDDVFAKLLLIAQLRVEGHDTAEATAATIVREARALTGVGRVSSTVKSSEALS